MTSPLWRRIKRFVESGRETPKVDLKLTQDISGKANQAEFAKDVTAIANTPGGDGYIIIGVQDQKDRKSQDPNDHVPGFRAPDNPDAFHRQMMDALTQFCNPVPVVEYDEIRHPDCGCLIGVATIRRSTKRPHSLIRGSGELEQHQIWIRRGTKSFSPPTVEELREMMGKTEELPASIVINLSTHPIDETQRAQIETDIYIEELIERPVQFRPGPLRPQIEREVDAIGLTIEEWQTKSIVLVLPGLAPPAAALLAYLHGLRGGFSKVLWIGPSLKDAGRYTVHQLIGLQDLRDAAREIRAGQPPESEA